MSNVAKKLSASLYHLYAPLVRNEQIGTIMRKSVREEQSHGLQGHRGRIWNSMGSGQIVLVMTTDPRTDNKREFPLLSGPSGDAWIIIGSN